MLKQFDVDAVRGYFEERYQIPSLAVSLPDDTLITELMYLKLEEADYASILEDILRYFERTNLDPAHANIILEGLISYLNSLDLYVSNALAKEIDLTSISLANFLLFLNVEVDLSEE